MSILLAACDSSEPFALKNGCYYAEDGKPILRVRGVIGTILTPDPAPNPVAGYRYTPVHRVFLRSRIGGDGAYVDIFPGFYLTDANEAATSSSWSRFRIDLRARPPTILVNVEAWGSTPVHLGRPC